VIKAHIKRMMTIVPKGSAAVVWLAHATLLLKQNVRKSGRVNSAPAISTFWTCRKRQGKRTISRREEKNRKRNTGEKRGKGLVEAC
jgi:hypothetical protein